MSRYVLTISGRLSQGVDTLRGASEVYAKAREESREGASTFPEGRVRAGGQVIARVSYNAKVWGPDPWKLGDVPLFSPYA